MKSSEFSDLDVLFFVPPVFRILGKKCDTYPIGLGYLVSSLDQINIKSAIYHANYMEVDESPPNSDLVSYISKQWEKYYATIKNDDAPIWHEITRILELTNPKIVGISSCIIDYPITHKIVDLIKKVNDKTIIIVGGAAATTYPAKLINNPKIDFLVIGEGELTLNELVPILLDPTRDDEKIRTIKGIMYKKGDVIIINEKRELIPDLDTIPFPNREKVFILDGSNELKSIYVTTDILLSRGCPFKCKFCSAYTIWGTRKPRSRSNDNIIKEIVYLNSKFKQTYFIFWDDLFTINKNKIIDLCNKLIQLDLNLKWVCLARIDTVDKNVLALMKKAGCSDIQFGIESGSDRILKYINKGITINQIIETAKVIRESNINWSIFLIIGFPTETEQEIQKTIKFVDILKPTAVMLSTFTPYPGTELYSELLQAGHITDKTDMCDAARFETNYTLTIPEKRFKEIASNAINYINRYNSKQTSFYIKCREIGLHTLLLAKKRIKKIVCGGCK